MEPRDTEDMPVGDGVLPVKPIYFRDAMEDGTLGYSVIWPGGFLSLARHICFIEGNDAAAEAKAQSVVDWLSKTEGP
jgi:hypothetical protein